MAQSNITLHVRLSGPGPFQLPYIADVQAVFVRLREDSVVLKVECSVHQKPFLVHFSSTVVQQFVDSVLQTTSLPAEAIDVVAIDGCSKPHPVVFAKFEEYVRPWQIQPDHRLYEFRNEDNQMVFLWLSASAFDSLLIEFRTALAVLRSKITKH